MKEKYIIATLLICLSGYCYLNIPKVRNFIRIIQHTPESLRSAKNDIVTVEITRGEETMKKTYYKNAISPQQGVYLIFIDISGLKSAVDPKVRLDGKEELVSISDPDTYLIIRASETEHLAVFLIADNYAEKMSRIIESYKLQ